MRIYYTIPIVRRHGQDKSDYVFCLFHIEEFCKMAIAIRQKGKKHVYA
jgi:hypothetical protein